MNNLATKRILLFTLSTLLISLLTSCENIGKQVPKCSDQKTIALVKSIALENLPIEPKETELALEAVRTTDFSKKTGKQYCACNLMVTINGQQFKFPITYTSELTDNEEHYIEVSGLK